jgi:hypothetical protein
MGIAGHVPGFTTCKDDVWVVALAGLVEARRSPRCSRTYLELRCCFMIGDVPFGAQRPARVATAAGLDLWSRSWHGSR